MSEAIDAQTFCAVHPDRETALRCNQCDRLMCVQCALHTPTGYRCRECVRQKENRFFAGTTQDYMIVAGACAVMGAIGGAVMAFTPFGFFLAFMFGAPAGVFIAQASLYVTFKRRGRYTGEVAVAAIVLGALVGGLFRFMDIELWIFAISAAAAAYARFKLRY